MAPLLKKEEYGKRSLYDIDPSSMHIHDLIHQEGCYSHRTSDMITGMLLLAVHEKIITKVEACWFAVPFTIGAKLRTSVYKHEGNPFLGPDGYPMLIAGTPFSGRGYVAQSSDDDGESDGHARPDRPSAYNFETMRQAENFDEWLAKTLFRGTHKDDSDFDRHNLLPPSRFRDGRRKDAPAPPPLLPTAPSTKRTHSGETAVAEPPPKKRSIEGAAARAPAQSAKADTHPAAQQQYETDFPEGHTLVDIPNSGRLLLCGLHAIRSSIANQCPALQTPTIEDLLELATNGEVAQRLQAIQQPVDQNFFGVAHLAGVLEEYGSQHGVAMQLGLHRGRRGMFIQFNENPAATTLWIHHERSHYTGMKKKEAVAESVTGIAEEASKGI